MNNKVPYLFIKKTNVKKDWKMHAKPIKKNNGRKIFVNELWLDKECHAIDTEWEAGPEGGATPVVETGQGGIEIATFTQKAGQDCHLHRIAIEIYTVLEGTMRIKIGDENPLKLEAGDEVVVLPGVPHEVLSQEEPFLTRLHSIFCYGDIDKYRFIKEHGCWCQEQTIKETNKRKKKKK